MVPNMEDFSSLTNRQLMSLRKTFEYGTDEWWDIQGELLKRRWQRLYGGEAAAEMYTQWHQLNVQRQQFDLWYGQQLELEL